MGDDAAFAGGVHPLQHQQDRAVVALLAVGVEHLLQVGEPSAAFSQDLRGVVLVAGEAGTGVGIDIGDLVAGAESQNRMGFMRPERRQIVHR